MSYCNDIAIGDLVCIKSHNLDATGGWMAYEVNTGIVIGIIEIEIDFYIYDSKTRCYDYVIYWTNSEKIETIPDLIVEKFSEWEERFGEGLR